jgi:hypothetical protein
MTETLVLLVVTAPIAIFATVAARKRPRPLTVGLSGAAWGFLIGAVLSAPHGPRLAGAEIGDGPAISAALALGVMGGGVGLAVGAWVALLGWTAASSSPQSRAGVALGPAAALAAGWPLMLLIPEQTFEEFEAAVFIPALILMVLIGASVGAGFGDGVARQDGPATRRVLLIEAVVIVGVGAVFSLIRFDQVRAHTQSTRQLQARGDVRGLRAKMLSADLRVRRRAARAYGRTDPIAGIEHSEHRVRYHAALELADRGDPKAVPALIRVMDDILEQGQGGFSTVAAALGRTRDARAVAALAGTAERGNPEVWAAAAAALREIGTPEARRALEQAGLETR